ncbi:hypothetical protein AGR7A_Lc120273 [Agrobacterium deltaense NCPPB 1641]|uniref:Uncharacterized protein n=1 Tax=Agrobacterium deltaense NCPPB 1641 TaxID=1183425 RepID=A0A1S7TW79_9HYPH|nr:hypothetical protein AGR7A_Lc120273 [Agrobacterium deltaense NCPPB 1641]
MHYSALKFAYGYDMDAEFVSQLLLGDFLFAPNFCDVVRLLAHGSQYGLEPFRNT